MGRLKHLCLDVDGVMTDGSFLYSENGKAYKRFGPDDSEALNVLKRFVSVDFVSADFRGLEISRARIERDMGFPLHLVTASERLAWISGRFPLDSVVYLGDSFTDAQVLQSVGLGIAPANASPFAKAASDYVTQSPGGGGAVAEACFYIAKIMAFNPPEFSFSTVGY